MHWTDRSQGHQGLNIFNRSSHSIWPCWMYAVSINMSHFCIFILVDMNGSLHQQRALYWWLTLWLTNDDGIRRRWGRLLSRDFMVFKVVSSVRLSYFSFYFIDTLLCFKSLKTFRRWNKARTFELRHEKNRISPCVTRGPWSRGFKHFHAQLNRARNSNCLWKLKYRQIKKFLALSLSDVVFIMLINVKMPTIAGILTFMSRINFVLGWAWKKFYNLGIRLV